MKTMVTGATGFIGNYVIEELLRQGHTLIASSSDTGKANKFPWFPEVTYIPLNFEHLDKDMDYFHYFREPDKMIHLAWEGLPNYKSSFHREINKPHHLLLLTNLVRNGLKDLTVTGTCFEYGMQEGDLKEDMLSTPANPYASAKDELRKDLEIMQTQYGFSFKWIRLFYIYGKGQNPNSLLSQLDKAIAAGNKSFNMSGGQQVRDYLPVETVAQYIVRIALQQRVTGIINCCSGNPVTVQEFVENYLKKTNQTMHLNLGYYPYPDYEPMRFWGDTGKMQEAISNKTD
jgi:dTDP-6-deoxy-L-talose 4-dehydrogenase (NAD+)